MARRHGKIMRDEHRGKCGRWSTDRYRRYLLLSAIFLLLSPHREHRHECFLHHPRRRIVLILAVHVGLSSVRSFFCIYAFKAAGRTAWLLLRNCSLRRPSIGRARGSLYRGGTDYASGLPAAVRAVLRPAAAPCAPCRCAGAAPLDIDLSSSNVGD